MALTHIPVLFFYDEESKNWGFSVEQPSLIGGGDSTLPEARAHAIEALSFALEHEHPEGEGANGTVERIPVEIATPGLG